ncbi:MAG: hypothetical protein LBT27_09515 [Prevotellaceae bacterium]|jgi:hypothetical protein|nr:hypothetical protein [Prevotellaceae bacterium]
MTTVKEKNVDLQAMNLQELNSEETVRVEGGIMPPLWFDFLWDLYSPSIYISNGRGYSVA